MTEVEGAIHPEADIWTALEMTSPLSRGILDSYRPELTILETGIITQVEQGIARVNGLPGIRADELVRFPGNRLGIAFDIHIDSVGVVLLDEGSELSSGMEVRRTGRVLEVPVGEALIGRVVDAVCRPRDNKGPVAAAEYRYIERQAPDIMDRLPVTEPMQTGIKVIDTLIPIGKGQRELIVGDRQTGKTAIAIDTIINQKGRDVICIYCAIGKESGFIAKVVSELTKRDAMEYTIVMMAVGEDPPGLQYTAPYSATTVGEYFLDRGRDVLIVYDDLTRHARIYREISLLLRRPPGREAFPGDIFYIHSRLLERSGHLRKELGGGSLTSLPIVETQAQNISAYIPTNLISITDGQVYLSPELFHKGQLPSVDVGRSVSRVGGKAQRRAYRVVAGDLRLSYTQFEELESFSRIGTRLDEQTRKVLERGHRVREALKQSQYDTMNSCEQITVLVAVTKGVFDEIPLEDIPEVEKAIRSSVKERLPEICDKIDSDKELSDQDWESLVKIARDAADPYAKRKDDAGSPGIEKKA